MKKLTTAIRLIAPFFALFLIHSCRKEPGTGSNGSPDQLLIQQAQAYLEQQHYPANPAVPGDTLSLSRSSLHKTPDWSLAQVQTLSFGKGVVVPIQVKEPLTTRAGADQHPVSASQITWLFMYTDSARAWHIEVVTKIPDSNKAQFQGSIRVEDWQGQFLKAFRFAGDSILTYASSTTFKQPITGKVPGTGIQSLSPFAPFARDCNVTDWYGCSTIGDGPVQCQYVYTTEDCDGYNDGASSPINGGTFAPGLPGAGDYGRIGSLPTSPQPTVASFKPDATITANPIVACVYNHLMDPGLTHGLKSILSSFDDNTIYNVNFTVSDGEDSADGVCAYKGNNTFQITLNGTEANDSTYSRIYLASTFIHEAFHAKLRQKALETFGELAVSQWSLPIDDMTLAELASYFEENAQAAKLWEGVEHDWMVNNIDSIAVSLQEFVKTFYPTTYAEVGSSLTPYEALMYMGLQDATIYKEDVTAKGLDATFQKYWGELNEGGKCSN